MVWGPGGHQGASRPAHHPNCRLFDQATPGPERNLRHPMSFLNDIHFKVWAAGRESVFSVVTGIAVARMHGVRQASESSMSLCCDIARGVDRGSLVRAPVSLAAPTTRSVTEWTDWVRRLRALRAGFFAFGIRQVFNAVRCCRFVKKVALQMF